MTDIIAPEAQTSNWTQLSYFRVFVHNDGDLNNGRYPLFSNNSQQLTVTVRLIARDASGNLATISSSDLNSIRLIDYTTSEVLEFENNSTPWLPSLYDFGWDWDRDILTSVRSMRLKHSELFESDTPETDSSEDWAPASKTMDDDRCPNGYQCFRFYISTSSNKPRRLAARIKNSAGTIFRTNYNDIEDPTGEGDKNGRFNSSFSVDPVSFPRLSSEYYGDRQANGSGHLKDLRVVSNYGDNRAYEHHVNIRLPNGKMIPIKYIKDPIAFTPRMVWANTGSDKQKTAFSFIGHPGETLLRMQSLIHTLGVENLRQSIHSMVHALYDNNATIKNPRTGQVVIGQIILPGKYWFYDITGAQVANTMQRDLTVVDIYGNIHELRYGMTSALNNLTLDRI